jgi:hypothetical protein
MIDDLRHLPPADAFALLDEALAWVAFCALMAMAWAALAVMS